MKQTLYNFIYLLVGWIHRLTSRVDKNILVFTSFPEFSDNSRALSEYLEGLDKYKIYWVVNNKKKYADYISNPRITFLQAGEWYGFKNLRIFIKAGWFFATHSFAYYNKYLKRKGQRYIYLWHGCGLKDADSSKKRHHGPLQFDTILLAGPFFAKYMAPKWFWPQNVVLSKGFPRYDWLLTKDPKALSFKRSLSASGIEKVVLWMPTFRNHMSGMYNDNDNIKSFPLIYNNEMWMRLDNLCHNLGVVIVVKLHPMQKEYDILWENLKQIKRISDLDLNSSDTTLYSFLSVTDGLITDYSSVAVDYLIVDRPMGFTLDDFDMYEAGRGFIVDNPKDYMPGYHMYSINDLEQFIIDIASDKDTTKEKRNALRTSLCYQSKNYCKEIAETIGLD